MQFDDFKITATIKPTMPPSLSVTFGNKQQKRAALCTHVGHPMNFCIYKQLGNYPNLTDAYYTYNSVLLIGFPSRACLHRSPLLWLSDRLRCDHRAKTKRRNISMRPVRQITAKYNFGGGAGCLPYRCSARVRRLRQNLRIRYNRPSMRIGPSRNAMTGTVVEGFAWWWAPCNRGLELFAAH